MSGSAKFPRLPQDPDAARMRQQILELAADRPRGRTWRCS